MAMFATQYSQTNYHIKHKRAVLWSIK